MGEMGRRPEIRKKWTGEGGLVVEKLVEELHGKKMGEMGRRGEWEKDMRQKGKKGNFGGWQEDLEMEN